MYLPRPTRRTVLTTAAASAAAILAIAGTSVAAAHRDVTVEVDGVSVPVAGFFTNVSGALSAAGVTLGDHDKVAPSADAAVSDGDAIVVRTANEYTLTVDGEAVSAWSTASSVDGIIGDLIAPGSTVAMPADRSEGRAELPVADAATKVSVVADGTTTEVETAANASADEILSKAGVTASAIDQVSFTREAGKLTLNVTRVQRGTTTSTENIDFTTEEREDDTLLEGTTQVVQEGVAGSVVTTYYRHSVDGKTVVDVKVKEERTDPVTQIVAVGTKKAATQTYAAASSSSSAVETPAAVVTGDVWAALAQCESGGNPSTNTGNGYYGMYQFSLPTWQAVGGSGLPSDASAAEQTMRAQILQARAGWGQWPACARALGLL